MLDIAFILENRDIIQKTLMHKNVEPVDFDHLETLYKQRSVLLKQTEALRHARKIAASERDTDTGIQLKKQLSEADDALHLVLKELTERISAIPNIPSPDTPIGKDENDNVTLRQWGELPVFTFRPKAHWQLGEERDFIDKERAAKVAGARFTFLKGEIVRLQFSLIQWVFDTVTDEIILQDIIQKNNLTVSSVPFIPVLPPAMIKPDAFFGMARLEPKEDKYFIPDDNLFLAGSAEHPLGAMHAGETFQEDSLPKRYIGYSTAFRRESGSYGKDTKGILRLHQFDKLEFECFTVGEKSKEEQDFLVAVQEHLMQKLGLPYQVVFVCTGDMGKPDIRQLDIETWMPGQNVYRETHSADLIGEYQARRLGIRVKRNSGEKEFVHMNDATAFALGRIIIAIMENNQEEDGSVVIPEVLRPYLGGRQKM